MAERIVHADINWSVDESEKAYGYAGHFKFQVLMCKCGCNSFVPYFYSNDGRQASLHRREDFMTIDEAKQRCQDKLNEMVDLWLHE